LLDDGYVLVVQLDLLKELFRNYPMQNIYEGIPLSLKAIN